MSSVPPQSTEVDIHTAEELPNDPQKSLRSKEVHYTISVGSLFLEPEKVLEGS